MARPRRIPYPKAAPGSLPYIVRTLVERDGRSMRAISLAAGLAGDAARNLMRQSSKAPRPRTIEALARTLGVTPAVLRGQVPIPDVKAPGGAEKPHPLGPHYAPVAHHTALRRTLREEIRAAVRKALAAGMSPEAALADSVMASQLAAVSAGLDEVQASGIIGSIGIQE